ncbi:hypothetical protein [Turicibacter bilis]|uniref:hypothetical protein n=1 Tax=Turicibacter bilis TaxID=2735723 RepID=UPI001BAEA53C|nr:hypothetical protein [Turicibacter bilis]MBS3199230.1 hypothetical protein [Turicibacter bilis]
MDESTEKAYECRSKIDQEQELMLREHNLKLQALDHIVSLQSVQLKGIEDEVTELKLMLIEMQSSNKILIYIASVLTTAIVTQIATQVFN